MQPTTHSFEHGRNTDGSATPTDSTPGSHASSSTRVATASVDGRSDATRIWIEQLRRLPRMTAISASMTVTPSGAPSRLSVPITASPWSFATTATSLWRRLHARSAHR